MSGFFKNIIGLIHQLIQKDVRPDSKPGAAMSSYTSPNFYFLSEKDPLLAKMGALAEKYLFDDPSTALVKIRQLAESIAFETAALTGIYTENDTFLDVLNKLFSRGAISPDIAQLFHGIRKKGNDAVHKHVGDQRTALFLLKAARAIAVWFYQSFHDPNFNPTPFVPPPNPADAEQALITELEQLRSRLNEQEKAAQQAQEQAQKAYADLSAALELAEETEEQLQSEREQFQAQLASIQEQTKQAPADEINKRISFAQQAGRSLSLDEADTRKLIDQQLRDAGWEVDTQVLTYGKGTRPQKGKNLAIAEYPVKHGVADYAFFCGLIPIAVTEAKRQNKNPQAYIEQAKRYSRNFVFQDDMQQPGGPWEDYKIPFLYSTNGRPYLRQLEQESGIWFLDARLPTNHSRPLEGWYTPEGLLDLLDLDVQEAESKLQTEPMDYLPLRDYQQNAIKAVEDAIAQGKRGILLAMATGTGKTRTCIGLAYRLIKARRFRRILFIVDRTALGDQAAGSFKDVKLEKSRTFHEIYDIKELADITPDRDTKLHLATIQGLVGRVLTTGDDKAPLAVDQYDCIIVDECHRGYILDKEMSETELLYRDQADYISKYRRVLDHFDAVKVGLTATPALHTTEIFGEPVFTYSYRQAVIEGWLNDHEPPIRIITDLAEDGIIWNTDEDIEYFDPRSGVIDVVKIPDQLKMEIDTFNSKVITPNFNKAVCGELARHIDPTLPGKTLIFCVKDSHADLVTRLLKEAFDEQYGGVHDDTVLKITANTDKTKELIRRFKNESLPSVAVTVDLLTTGIDVPEITSLVFLRRIRSRILYEQMLGRATRLCPEINKECFHIFDAVNLYAVLAPYTTMRPVVTNPKTTFVQLARELTLVEEKQQQQQVFDQLVSKLQAKKRIIKGRSLEEFKTLSGMEPNEFVRNVRNWGAEATGEWFKQNPKVAVFLDQAQGEGEKLIISHHEDNVRRVEHGYGSACKPEDYLESFKKFIADNINRIPALLVVTQRPRDLTRKQLKDLKLELEKEDFREAYLQSAWRDLTNEEIAASIIGFIRQAALGSPLIPYSERVDRAMRTILASRNWTTPQRKWLERIAKQLQVETIVDRDSLDQGEFRAQGGFTRLNKVFDGELEAILKEINEALWRDEHAA